MTANSVYEATARALRAFRDAEWSSEDAYATGYVEIVVKQPDVRHKVLLKNFHSWLSRAGGSPREITEREFVQEILEGRN